MTKISYNQSGFSTIKLVVIVVIVGMGYFAWNSFGEQVLFDVSAMFKRATCEKTNDKDICRFLSSSGRPGEKFHMSLRSEDVNTEVDYDGENFYSITTIDGDTREIVQIGDAVYAKNPTDGIWYKGVAKGSKTSSAEKTQADKKFDSPSIEDIDSVKYTRVGKESCQNMKCFKYLMSVSVSGNDGGIFYLFDDKDYKLREIKVGSLEYSYTYDNAKSVRVPSPVKDLSSK